MRDIERTPALRSRQGDWLNTTDIFDSISFEIDVFVFRIDRYGPTDRNGDDRIRVTEIDVEYDRCSRVVRRQEIHDDIAYSLSIVLAFVCRAVGEV